MEKEVLEYLRADKGGTFLDCTVGGGGHALAVLAANSENSLVGIDRDERAVARSTARLEHFGPRAEITQAPFASAAWRFAGRKFDGVLADLGLSSDQLREGRGFSFSDTGELDMRMDQGATLTAGQIVNGFSESDLFRVLKQGGVGKEARIAARAIVAARPVNSSRELADLLSSALARYTLKKKVHPATVVFQAIRMAVNDEISQLQSFLQDVPSLMGPGGRLVVISFHSLEDKLVARTMRDWSCGEFSALWPGSTRRSSIGELLTRKAVTPGADEIDRNPASRSARLRAFAFG